jgi:hypothetical protein
MISSPPTEVASSVSSWWTYVPAAVDTLFSVAIGFLFSEFSTLRKQRREDRSWTRRGLPRFERKAWGGSGSPLEWELGSELSIASPWMVPKLGKRFFEPAPRLDKTA